MDEIVKGDALADDEAAFRRLSLYLSSPPQYRFDCYRAITSSDRVWSRVGYCQDWGVVIRWWRIVSRAGSASRTRPSTLIVSLPSDFFSSEHFQSFSTTRDLLFSLIDISLILFHSFGKYFLSSLLLTTNLVVVAAKFYGEELFAAYARKGDLEEQKKVLPTPSYSHSFSLALCVL